MPERVFVVVVESEAARDPDGMPVLSRNTQGGARLAPIFSSMLLATTFLSRAQALGHYVKLDYIFPADGRRVAADFPGHAIHLDPSPEAFFGSESSV